MALSPYLNSHPIDLAFALGKYDKTVQMHDSTSVEIRLLIDGAMVQTTGPVRLENLAKTQRQYHGYVRKKSKVRMEYVVTRSVRNFPYAQSGRLPVVPTYLPNGRATILVSGLAVRSSSKFRKALARAQALSKNPWVSKSRDGRSTSLRPNPQIVRRQFFRHHELYNNFTQTSVSDSVVPYTGYFREWTGVRTPGYGSLKKRSLPDNPHTARITIVSDNRYHWYQEQAASGTWDLRISPYSEFYSMPDSPTLFNDAAEFNALQRLISKAQTGLQANMAQNIAQVSQLSSLIFGNATKISKALYQLKKGNIPSAINTLTAGRVSPSWKGPIGSPSKTKSVASNWLQLQYGWKPLLSDIEGFMTAMGNLNAPNDTVQRVSSSATAQRQFNVAYPPDHGLFIGSGYGKTTFIVTTTTKFKIRFRVDDPLTAFLAQTGFTNPINLFWEILPFSFVFDWFLPIGNYLQSLSAWHGVTFLGGSKVRFSRIRGNSAINYHGAASGEPTVRIDMSATQTRDEVRLERSALSSFPSPVLPSFNSEGLSAGTRALNAVALLLSSRK